MTTHLPQYVIATRYAGSPWPQTGTQAAAIAKARKEYEDGRIEMAQRREGNMWFQYAIPRKTRGLTRFGYFQRTI